MAVKNRGGRGGVLVAGIGFGVAAGVALGALVISPSQPAGGGQAAQVEQSREASLAAKIDAAQADSADQWISDRAEQVVAGSLDQRPVLVMRTHDAEDADVENISWLLERAGAVDAGQLTLEGPFFAQDQADQLKSIVATTLPTGAQLSEESLDPGTHAGDALGAALLMDPGTAEPLATPEERALVLESLADAGYLSYEQGTIRPAQAVVIVTGGNDGTGDSSFGADTLAAFAESLDTTANGTVLAGRITAASDTGPITRVREQAGDAVSTVDSTSRTWGRMATVLAVREQIDGGSGAYGSASSAVDGAAPPAPQE